MSMSNLQVGTFVLNMELLVYVLAGMVGVLAVRFRQRAHPDRERIVSVAWNAVFLWLVVWKGSLLLFDPVNVIDHPLSLLFFSGGTKGIWLASAVAIGYLVFRYGKRMGIAQAAAVTATLMSGWAAAVYMARIVLSDSTGVYSYLALLLSVVLLVWLLNPSRNMVWRLRLTAQMLGVLLIITMIAYTVFDNDDTKSSPAGQTADQTADQVETGIHRGQLAPNFRLTDLEGNTVSLSDYRGKTVLMNFWATWCRVCQAEMPHMEKIYQKYKDQDVVILSVNVTSKERNAQLVERYADKHGLSFPVVLDEEGSVMKQYKVTAYPTTFIVDSKGMIQDHYLGAISYENMRKALRDIG